MEEKSILTSIKKLLGVDEDYTQFDTDIIIHINTVFMTLKQLGVGPTQGFKIADNTAEWEDFITDRIDLEGLKTYIYLKVRLVFDPPQSSYLIENIKEQIKELEWRLNFQVESIEGGL
jgi:hypothetical protein